MSALDRLIEAVEAGTQYVSMDMTDPVAAKAFKGCTLEDAGKFHEACQGKSLDAALSLFEALLPGWEWTLFSEDGTGSGKSYAQVMPPQAGPLRYIDAEADNPARALLIATLKAFKDNEKRVE